MLALIAFQRGSWYNFPHPNTGGENKMADNKQTRKEKTRRMIALVIAGVMTISIVAAAVLSQVW